MQKKGVTPQILGVDLIRSSPPKGISFIQGDFLNPDVQSQIFGHFNNSPVNLILSDMMTNTTGIKDIDHLGSMDLCHSVLQLSQALLNKNGSVVMKFFMGKEQELIESKLREMFAKVYTFKPQSSRDESREQFFIGMKKRLRSSEEKD
ncbi:2' O-ribose methyltransferase [Yamadazyma tenuis]|nr:2' O-ribose methyltransferase [Yamadazyma tenuis]